MVGKLTADLILLSPQFTNALKEREIDLRENKLTVIENLGATMDQFDTIDLSDNEIRRLEGFPVLGRLRTLFLNNNRISRIGDGMEEALPRLEELVLTNNNIVDLADLRVLFPIKTLKRLSLMRNPVTARAHYRAYVIYNLPHLRMLDFQKVKLKERQDAKALFEGAEGAQLLEAIAASSSVAQKLDKVAQERQKEEDAARAHAAAHAAKIKEAITRATSLEEVQRLEAQLKAGIMPGEAPPAPPPGANEMETDD